MPVDEATDQRGLGRIGPAFGVSGYPRLWVNSILFGLNFLTYGLGQGWLILELTDSPVLVGAGAGIQGTATILLTPISGVLADRIDRRRLLIGTQIAAGLLTVALGVLALLDQAPLGLIFAMAAFQGVNIGTQFTARGGYTYDLVGPATIANALTLQFLAMYGSGIVGPLLGGVLLDLEGPGAVFLLVGGLTITGSGLLLGLPSPPPARSLGGSVRQNLLEGLTFALRDRHIRLILSILLVTELLGFSFLFLLPVMVRDVLGRDPTNLGILSAAWGLGGVTATLIISTRFGDLRARAWVLLLAVCTLGAALVLFSFSRSVPLSFALIMLAGMAGVTYDVTSSTLFQTLAPDHMRGRLVSLHGTLLGGGFLGALLIGGAAEFGGADVAIAIGASVVIINGLRLLPLAGDISQRSQQAASSAPVDP